ncbi:putative O-methyltransferase [Seiridium cardinale]|uniref:O-methyltransferase n=1 Tax=Seiridium cardinale TaxID=138064 RepID=A0ABR2YA26_9PEZI
MPTDTTSIIALSKTIIDLAQKFDNSATPSKEVQQALVLASEQLAIAAREPDDNVYNISGQISQTAAIRSAIALNAFELMPEDGSTIAVEDIASKMDADPELIGRVLRACASAHVFGHPTVNQYCHNTLSRVYLQGDNRQLAAQIYDFTGHAVLAIPDFGEEKKWRSMGDYVRGPFQRGFATDLGYMEYLQANPQRLKSWNSGMRTGKIGHRTSAFPFDRALQLDPCGQGGIAIVDVGGGRGQALEGIHQDYPDLVGRLVLQDLPEVIEDAKANGLPDYIETTPGTFFDPLAAKGARIYHFRRVFHIWTQKKALELLENTKNAMDDYSRVLIADMVLADVDCERDLAMQDLNMMSLGGMERSESEWTSLIESAGLVLRKVWQNDQGPKHAVVEATLPTFKGHNLLLSDGVM